MENFQLSMEKVLERLPAGSDPPRLLLHSCCGPCSTAVLEALSAHFRVTLLFYNPNIRPEGEYVRRLQTQRDLLAQLETPYPIELLEIGYRPEEFDSAAEGLEDAPEGGARCTRCIALRLDQAAQIAAREGFDYFCTTLSVSPHKNAPLINALGQEAEDKYSVRWLPSDFKKRDGYKKSVALSARYGLYRQDYCGCRPNTDSERGTQNP